MNKLDFRVIGGRKRLGEGIAYTKKINNNNNIGKRGTHEKRKGNGWLGQGRA